jgi:hypothetical protein
MTNPAGPIHPFGYRSCHCGHPRVGSQSPGTRRERARGAGDSACGVGAPWRWRVNRRYLKIAIVSLVVIGLTACATPRHQFAEPAGDWKVRSGQLLYRAAGTTLIGDVIVRFSKSGDFELVFSKGPGVTLLSLRQDASFAQVKGPFAGSGWSGAVEQAPKPLRGWLGLRDKLIHSQDQSVQYTAGAETFLFRF